MVAYATSLTPRVWWGLALVAPQMIAAAVLGTVLHDPDQGASLWMVTEVFLVVDGLLAWGEPGLERLSDVADDLHEKLDGAQSLSPKPSLGVLGGEALCPRRTLTLIAG